jgi:hypothetical protein
MTLPEKLQHPSLSHSALGTPGIKRRSIILHYDVSSCKGIVVLANRI